jgi:hypothetical protein
MAGYPITYEFELEGGDVFNYEIELDDKTISLTAPVAKEKPDWTRLPHEQCPECPLDEKEHPHCPIALNIGALVEHFKSHASIDKATVRVVTPERTYSRETSVQDGLFSILGIVMATSGCPRMNFLKPMARFHLPFSSNEETMVRSTSLYLLGQYFKIKKGEKPDLELKALAEKYEKVGAVNQGILKRLEAVVKSGDADANAIVILDGFAMMLGMVLEDDLQIIEYLFDEGARDAEGS